MFFVQEKKLDRFKARRTKVIEQIKKLNPKIESGVLLLIADFESTRYPFKQESSFYYLTGISEPAVVMCCYFNGPDILYIPFYAQSREQWVKTDICLNSKTSDFSIDQIKCLGSEIKGYSCTPFFTPERYGEILADLKKYLGHGGMIYTLLDAGNFRYFIQMQFLARLQDWLLDQKIIIQDISGIAHQMRRFKDNYEINLIYSNILYYK